ncbi:TPA: hypothetical protein P0E18_004513 [Vibrio harveyi]|nr:hypothetical protein [Vibrio harveyi]
MALIDTYKRQLKQYEDAEARILDSGQSVTDEDGRTFREGNLAHIQAEKRRLQGLINQIQYPQRLGNYPVE